MTFTLTLNMTLPLPHPSSVLQLILQGKNNADRYEILTQTFINITM